MAETQKEFGRRVAFLRKRLGYSQAELARKVERSETWLSQVERGVRRIDRMSVLERLADALDVPVADLAPDEPTASVGADAPSVASELAVALASSSVLRSLLDPPLPVDAHEIEQAADTAWQHVHACRYDALGELLVDLLPRIESLNSQQASATGFARARKAGARVYLAVAAALAKLGDSAAAWVAIDRAASAAAALGEPLLAAECAFRLANLLLGARRVDLAITAADTAAAAIAPLAATEGADPQAISLFGALHLQMAVAAARTGVADDAYEHISAARAAADRIGRGRNDFNTEFGPANVGLHEVAVAVELGDAGRAVRVAAQIDTSGLSAERRARLLTDVAAANAQLRRTDEVIHALSEALSIAPQQIAGHPRAQGLVADLVREHGRDQRVSELANKIATSPIA